MSTIKEKLRQQEAAFISIDEALLSMAFSDWESTIRDVATFLCQTVPMHDSQMFLSRRENGTFRDASLDEVLPLIDFIASTGRFLTELAYGHESPVKSTGYETYGFRRSEFARFMALHGLLSDIGNEHCEDQNDAMPHSLSQLEAENARLVEKVAELERQLQAATVATEQAPQQAAPALRSDYEHQVRRWPWGEHHTQALGHLEAAGVRFWQSFDPSDPCTANTNETVIEWLINERGASREKARSIASLLRADGLPPGPRR